MCLELRPRIWKPGIRPIELFGSLSDVRLYPSSDVRLDPWSNVT